MSKTENKDRDVAIWAIPSENKAEVEANTAEGLIFVQREFGTASKTGSVNGESVNALMAKIKEAKLNFSFRLKV